MCPPHRVRTTFADRSTLDVRSLREMLFYGPETAKAYAKVSEMHRNILGDRELVIDLMYRPVNRCLTYGGYSLGERNIIFARLFPDEWERVCPWRRLSREGYTIIWEAADQDTDDYFEHRGSDDIPPWTPMLTPKDAYECYGLAA